MRDVRSIRHRSLLETRSSGNGKKCYLCHNTLYTISQRITGTACFVFMILRLNKYTCDVVFRENPMRRTGRPGRGKAMYGKEKKLMFATR